MLCVARATLNRVVNDGQKRCLTVRSSSLVLRAGELPAVYFVVERNIRDDRGRRVLGEQTENRLCSLETGERSIFWITSRRTEAHLYIVAQTIAFE